MHGTVEVRASRNGQASPHGPPRFLIECVRLAMRLKAYSDLGSVCRQVARIMFPQEDITQMRFPSGEEVRQMIIKLDMVYMLSGRRLLVMPIRVRFYLSPDSSPQLKNDYLCIVEEVLKRKLPIDLGGDNFAPFKGVEYERRTKPSMTMPRSETSVAAKTHRMVHACTLESGSEHLFTYRHCVYGFLSDQGPAERGMRSSPVGTAPAQVVAEALQGLRNGVIRLDDEIAKNLMLFPNALEQIGSNHVSFNELNNALRNVPEWAGYKKGVTAMAKVTTDPSYKEVLLQTCFKDAPGEERATLHRANRNLVN